MVPQYKISEWTAQFLVAQFQHQDAWFFLIWSSVWGVLPYHSFNPHVSMKSVNFERLPWFSMSIIRLWNDCLKLQSDKFILQIWKQDPTSTNIIRLTKSPALIEHVAPLVGAVGALTAITGAPQARTTWRATQYILWQQDLMSVSQRVFAMTYHQNCTKTNDHDHDGGWQKHPLRISIDYLQSQKLKITNSKFWIYLFLQYTLDLICLFWQIPSYIKSWQTSVEKIIIK